MSLYGVRLFLEQQGFIVSPIKRVIWDADIIKASCIDRSVMPEVHWTSTPAVDCACGFYANWTLQHLLDCANKDEGSFALYGPPLAIGLVEAFGKIVMHQLGFRSEYMRIIGFLPLITDTHETRHPTGEKLLGFPIMTLSRQMELRESKTQATFCSELIGVQCIELKTANDLLDRSYREYQ